MKDWSLLYVAENADEIFRSIRWENGLECPSCSSHNIVKLQGGRYKCRDCGEVFSDKSGTLFHGSKLPLSYWMVALYLDLCIKGLSGYELARQLQVTYKTAYYMLMRLRQAFDQDDIFFTSPLVAHDEVFIGGDYRNFCLRKKQQFLEKFNLPRNPKTVAEKIAIGNAVNQRTKKGCFGITDGKRVVLRQVPTPIDTEDIVRIYNKHVSPHGLAVSDCSALYYNWQQRTGRELHTNNHSKGQYLADNGTSSNMIENVFSWLERSNMFVHVHYSRAYTQLYLDEFAFKFNTRHMTPQERLVTALRRCQRRYDRGLLERLNKMEKELYREDRWFNPRAFFRDNPTLAREIRDGGVVYRREDWIDDPPPLT